MNFKQLCKRYSHAWVFLYALIYLPWFFWLEQQVTTDYYVIQSPLDQYIPFVEYFIIPYLLWFAFIVVGAGYFFFTDQKSFYKMAAFLIIGMTVFLIICTVFPNGLHLRPTTFARENLFTRMVQKLYLTDTPTNVLPSIHVFNSLGIAVAVAHSDALRNRRWIQGMTYAFAGLIILSTVFLKQHSVTDVIAAFALAAVIYPFIYAPDKRKVPKLSSRPAHSRI